MIPWNAFHFHLTQGPRKAGSHVFIKQLCAEGCNEPVLLQPSSQLILWDNYVFTERKKKGPQTSATSAWDLRWGGDKSPALSPEQAADYSVWGVGEGVKPGPGDPYCCCNAAITVIRNPPWLCLHPGQRVVIKLLGMAVARDSPICRLCT